MLQGATAPSRGKSWQDLRQVATYQVAPVVQSVALGRVVLKKRERVIALEPHCKGILATTLRYPYEVRKAEEHFGVPLPSGGDVDVA